MTERSSLSESLTASPALDPELLALPAPPRATRGVLVGLLAVTALSAIILSIGLASDVRYAFAASVPDAVADLSVLAPTSALSNTFVTATATLDASRALLYDRTTESDRFALVPVVGNPWMWVEMRLPRGALRPDPPPVFVGRLVPMRSAAFRYRGLGRSQNLIGTPASPATWVLIDGATPTSYRWTVPLAALLLVFSGYSLTTIVRLLRKVRR